MSFSAPSETIAVNGLLFDFDGTLVDSTPAIVKHWHRQGELLGVDPDEILATSHGRRSIDTFMIYDKSKANWDYVREIEGRIPRDFGSDAIELPGARAVLQSLDDIDAPWAIVTSATRALIDGWVDVLKLAQPKRIVVAEDVERGKPNPDCYLLGQKKLGLERGSEIVVVEDSPTGIRAGKAAGFKVIGLATTHTIPQVRDAGSDWIIKDLSSVKVLGLKDGLVQMEISNALESS